MRRSFGRHELLPWLRAIRHRSRRSTRRQPSRQTQAASPAAGPPGRLRSAVRGLWFLLALLALLIAIAASWPSLAVAPLEVANDLSVTVLDRNDRLLRAYTSADGRWRLPI